MPGRFHCMQNSLAGEGKFSLFSNDIDYLHVRRRRRLIPFFATCVRGVHSESFRDTGLGVDASYTYRIRAFDGARVSDWSNGAEASTPLLCLS